MTPPLTAARRAGILHRVGRAPDAWAWPPWAYAGEDGTFGNRFDDPAGEYRVLYASSPRVGAFLETLARYRIDPAIVAAYGEIAADVEDDRYPTIPPGVVPAIWRVSRRIGAARHDGPFAGIGRSSSLAHLRAALASRLVHYGLEDLDGGELRRRAPRAFTQEISRYVFERGVAQDGERLLGIRFLSRLGDDIENLGDLRGQRTV
jgi:RES domain